MLTLTGCANPNGNGFPGLGSDGNGGRTQVTPDDFLATNAPPDPAAQYQESGINRPGQNATDQDATAGDATARDDASPSAPTTATADDRATDMAMQVDRFAADAMVGQVNGNAVFARDVFEPIHEQLGALGQQLSPSDFRRRARELIGARLNEILTNALMLGEANRDLRPNERLGLEDFIRRKREELLRQHGRGSLAVADATLREETGYSFEETIEREREKVIVQRYLGQRLRTQINVTRREIERYYQDNQARYNPPARRTLHLIRAAQGADADSVAEQLAGGRPFPEVAALPANRYKPQEAGLFAEDAQGETVFGQEALNEAMLGLGVGETSQAIPVGAAVVWVHVAAIEQPRRQSIRDVQLEIQDQLREEKYRQALQDYRMELIRNGSFTDPEKMLATLMDVAMSRYAALEVSRDEG